MPEKPTSQMSLREAGGAPKVQLGDTQGRMIAIDNPVGAAFLWVDKTGALCSLEWEAAIRRFGKPKSQ